MLLGNPGSVAVDNHLRPSAVMGAEPLVILKTHKFQFTEMSQEDQQQHQLPLSPGSGRGSTGMAAVCSTRLTLRCSLEPSSAGTTDLEGTRSKVNTNL